MKPWMKYALWFFIGGGIGFFAGLNRGLKGADEAFEAGRQFEKSESQLKEVCEKEKEALKALREYAAVNEAASKALDEPATDEKPLFTMNYDEDPEMPMEEPVIDEEDIPQLHPEDLKPEIINEDEFNINYWHYDLENLLFYSMDEVLYNERTQSVIENPDQVVGIGTLFGFGGDPNNPIHTLYVKNDTFGTLFRIDWLDAAFCDAVEGLCPPEDDDPEEEDFTKDDYWDDV